MISSAVMVVEPAARRESKVVQIFRHNFIGLLVNSAKRVT